MLRDRAFESGALFDAELITDQSDILHEITDDFWRRHFYAGEPIVTTLGDQKRAYSGKILSSHYRAYQKPNAGSHSSALMGILKLSKPNAARSGTNCVTAGADARIKFAPSSCKMRGPNIRMATRPRWLFIWTKLGNCLSDAAGALDQLDCLAIFAFSKIERKRASGYNAPKHDLFTLCDRLLNSREEALPKSANGVLRLGTSGNEEAES